MDTHLSMCRRLHLAESKFARGYFVRSVSSYGHTHLSICRRRHFAESNSVRADFDYVPGHAWFSTGSRKRCFPGMLISVTSVNLNDFDVIFPGMLSGTQIVFPMGVQTPVVAVDYVSFDACSMGVRLDAVRGSDCLPERATDTNETNRSQGSWQCFEGATQGRDKHQ